MNFILALGLVVLKFFKTALSAKTSLSRRIKEHLSVLRELRRKYKAGDLDANQYEHLRCLEAQAIERLYYANALGFFPRCRFLLFRSKENEGIRISTSESARHEEAEEGCLPAQLPGPTHDI